MPFWANVKLSAGKTYIRLLHHINARMTPRDPLETSASLSRTMNAVPFISRVDQELPVLQQLPNSRV